MWISLWMRALYGNRHSTNESAVQWLISKNSGLVAPIS